MRGDLPLCTSFYYTDFFSITHTEPFASFLPVSFGWAAGDVSLAAYIQSTLSKIESKNKQVSALGAVMAFVSTHR